MDEHNHALAALRYLITPDARHMVARRTERPPPVDLPAPRPPPWLRLDNEALWPPL